MVALGGVVEVLLLGAARVEAERRTRDGMHAHGGPPFDRCHATTGGPGGRACVVASLPCDPCDRYGAGSLSVDGTGRPASAEARSTHAAGSSSGTGAPAISAKYVVHARGTTLAHW